MNNINDFLNKTKLDAILLFTRDEYFNQYVANEDNFVKIHTNFSGSNGYAFLTKTKGYLFTDGRYLTQAKQEINTEYFEIIEIKDHFTDFIKEKKFDEIGVFFDTLKISEYIKFASIDSLNIHDLSKLGLNKTKNKKHNVIYPLQKEIYDLDVLAKLEKFKSKVNFKKDEIYFISSLTDIAWLSNMRGSDVSFSPLFNAKAFISDKLHLFININALKEKEKIDNNIILHEISDFENFINENKDKIFYLDEDFCNLKDYKLIESFAKNKIYNFKNPTEYFRSIKSEKEIENIKKAHIYDAVALIKLCKYMYEHPCTDHSEMSIVNKLEEFRQENKNYKGMSFPTICGFNENGAIIHYRVSGKTNKNFTKNGILLLDAGGQYIQGTTDATRVYSFGKIDKEIKKLYTRVLKGHIALINLKFPHNTKGSQIDVVARQFLWQKSLDYNHGTGHGVGNFLNVHEGPHSISKFHNGASLEEGMIVSIEPGFYLENKFGLRIENLVHIVKCKNVKSNNVNSSNDFLKFKNLTLLPLNLDLIDKKMLSSSELAYITKYHKKICKILAPYLSKEENEFLYSYCYDY